MREGKNAAFRPGNLVFSFTECRCREVLVLLVPNAVAFRTVLNFRRCYILKSQYSEELRLHEKKSDLTHGVRV